MAIVMKDHAATVWAANTIEEYASLRARPESEREKKGDLTISASRRVWGESGYVDRRKSASQKCSATVSA